MKENDFFSFWILRALANPPTQREVAIIAVQADGGVEGWSKYKPKPIY